MDEGVDTVDPVQDGRTNEEPLLDVHLPEYVQALLQMYELQGVLPGNIDSALDERQCRDSSTDLVHKVDEEPVPGLGEEGELSQGTTQQTVLKDERIRRRHDALEAKDLELAAAKCGLLVGVDAGRTRAAQQTVGRVPLLKVIGALAAGVLGPARPCEPEPVVLVAVEVGAPEEEGYHYERLKK